MRAPETPAQQQRPESAAGYRLPVSGLIGGLIALATFALISHGAALPFVAAFALALLGTYLTTWRLDVRTPLQWILRVALIGVTYAYTHMSDSRYSDPLVGPTWTRTFVGILFGGEMVLQAWRVRPENPSARLYALFCSGFLFLTDCNTFDDRFMRLIAPPYMLCEILGLRAFRRQSGALAVDAARPGRPRRPFAQAAQIAALVVSLAAGFGLYRVFVANRGQITDWGNNLLSQHLPEMDASGMSDQPTLGRVFNLRGSQERVLRITGTTDDPGSGYAGDPHLRGLSFDTYDHGRWGPSLPERNLIKPADFDIRIPNPAGGPAPVTTLVRVTRLVRGNPLVYAPLNASEIDATGADNLGWAPDSGGPIRSPSPPPFIYTISLPASETAQGVLATPALRANLPAGTAREARLQAVHLAAEARSRSLDIPESLDPRVETLAREIVGGRTGAPAKIEAIVAYLMTHHRYATSIDPGRGDPVSKFLLSDPPLGAHCEYFAASAALMLRCVGVPARYVTGYYLHESDGPNTSIVRQRDAHAWAEAWVDGVGWVTVDATPGDGRPDFEPSPIPRWQAAVERIQDVLQAIRDWLGDLKPEQVNQLVGATTAASIAGGAIWLFLRRQRRGAGEIVPPFAYTLPSEALAALAARFETALARRGAPLPESRTWQEHLSLPETAAALGDSLPAARRFAALYDRARFGPPPAGEAAADTVAALDELLVRVDGETAVGQSA